MQGDLVAEQYDSAQKTANSRRGKNFEFYFALTIVILTIALFYLGNKYWDERYYTPDEGFGYYLGLIGGSMMLLAFGYAAFKYFPLLRSSTVMKIWLNLHLVFGILGPVLVMFHTTFRIGSVNGGVAMIAMYVMFFSGVIARFLYSKTHRSLDGNKSKVKDLKEMLNLAGRSIKSEKLEHFTESITSRRNTFFSALWVAMSFGWRSRILYWRLTSDLHRHLIPIARQNKWSASVLRKKKREFKRQLRTYIVTLKKVAMNHVYERFFIFWRNAHVPISYLLLMSGIVHVLAVHMY